MLFQLLEFQPKRYEARKIFQLVFNFFSFVAAPSKGHSLLEAVNYHKAMNADNSDNSQQFLPILGLITIKIIN